LLPKPTGNRSAYREFRRKMKVFTVGDVKQLIMKNWGMGVGSEEMLELKICLSNRDFLLDTILE
jgi:hypothetical protein